MDIITMVEEIETRQHLKAKNATWECVTAAHHRIAPTKLTTGLGAHASKTAQPLLEIYVKSRLCLETQSIPRQSKVWLKTTVT